MSHQLPGRWHSPCKCSLRIGPGKCVVCTLGSFFVRVHSGTCRLGTSCMLLLQTCSISRDCSRCSWSTPLHWHCAAQPGTSRTAMPTSLPRTCRPHTACTSPRWHRCTCPMDKLRMRSDQQRSGTALRHMHRSTSCREPFASCRPGKRYSARLMSGCCSTRCHTGPAHTTYT